MRRRPGTDSELADSIPRSIPHDGSGIRLGWRGSDAQSLDPSYTRRNACNHPAQPVRDTPSGVPPEAMPPVMSL